MLNAKGRCYFSCGKRVGRVRRAFVNPCLETNSQSKVAHCVEGRDDACCAALEKGIISIRKWWRLWVQQCDFLKLVLRCERKEEGTAWVALTDTTL
jgi:hypothetical protein